MISVIIPTYNRKKMLKTAIFSVLAQIYENYEIIVVDDCSSDGTLEFIRKKFKDEIDMKRLRIYRNKTNRNKSYSRNFGVQKARGDKVAFLDDDDFWMPNHLSVLAKSMKNNPGFKFFSTNAIVYLPSGRSVKVVEGLKSGSGIKYRELFLKGKLASSNCVLMDKEFFLFLGGFDEETELYEDRYFFSKAVLEEDVYFCEMPTVGFCPGTHSYSLQQNRESMAYDKEKICNEIFSLINKSTLKFSKSLKRDIYFNLSYQFSFVELTRSYRYLFNTLKVDPLFVLNLLFWRQLVFIIRKKGLNSDQFEEVI